jgi:hypothetical protein
MGNGQKLASCRLLPARQLRHNRPARQARMDAIAFSKERTNREGQTMAKQDASNENRPSLEQAQYEYRKTIYFAGLKILETFSEAVIGRDPSDGRALTHLESRDGAPAEAHADKPPPGKHIYGSPPIAYGPPPGGHIYIYGPPPGVHIYGPPPPPPSAGSGYGQPPVADGPPPGGHIYIYGPPPGLHIYGPPPPPVADGPPPGGHINAIIRLVEVVLSLRLPP